MLDWRVKIEKQDFRKEELERWVAGSAYLSTQLGGKEIKRLRVEMGGGVEEHLSKREERVLE